MITKKICKKCKIEKPVSEFYKDSSSEDLYCMTCKECKTENSVKKKKTIFGLISKMFWSQYSSSISRKLPKPEYTLQEFTEWVVFNPSFKKLYYDWVNSGYSKEMIPSVDRLNDYKGYSFGNIQLMTWEENCEKGRLDRINGVNTKNTTQIVAFKRGLFYKEYGSIAQAERDLGITYAKYVVFLVVSLSK